MKNHLSVLNRFSIMPLHEAINQKAQQRLIQLDVLGVTFGLNPYYIFSDNKPQPKLSNGHDWMNS
jgi:hypothetical protein